MSKRLNLKLYQEAEYLGYFPENIRGKALEMALDVRKFEIDLYWKTAAYFWTLIAATFVGFIATKQVADAASRFESSLVVACLGSVFSLAWFCINKGSKYWQMNWEKHVDLLESDLMGPIYKINWLAAPLTNEDERRLRRNIKSALVEGGRFSVTRINQIVSLFVLCVWMTILAHSILSNLSGLMHSYCSAFILLTFATWALILTLGRSGRDRPLTVFKMRNSPSTGSVE
jgi:hypothetical protein